MNPQVSIVISTVDRAEYLEKNLYCLLEQDFQEPYEIIVVDCGSTDKTHSICKVYQDYLPLKYIYRPQEANSSPAESKNIGWRQANGEYIVFTDPENLIPFSHLRLSYKYHQENSNSITTIRPIYLSEPYTKEEILNNPEWIMNIDKLFVDSISRFEKCVINPWKRFHFSMVKKANLENVDGFNEKFTSLGFEDVDLTERLMNAGLKLHSFSDEGLHIYHQWHIDYRNEEIANDQYRKFGVKNQEII